MREKFLFVVFVVLLVLLIGGTALQARVSIAINDSPWLPGFQKLVEFYEKQTGGKVDLHIFPFTGLLAKELAAVSAPQSEFSILVLNEGWYSTFYDAGFVTPLKDIDPEFKLDPQIIEYAYATRWDPKKGYSTPNGIIYGLPINGNIQLFFYRGDVYDDAGLAPPVTWENDVMPAAEKLGEPPRFYGYCNRGAKEGIAISWDWLPFLRGFGGDIFANPPQDWTVTINSEAGVKALKLYLKLAQYAPQGVAHINQAEQIALMAGDKLLQTILVCAAYRDMDDLEKSVVVNKVKYTVVPRPAEGRHSVASGIWVMGIPRNLPDDDKREALEFMKWATSFEAQVEYAKAGAIPVRQDVYTSELANTPQFRYMKAMAESTPYIDPILRIPEAPQIWEVLGLRLNQALMGELEAREALDLMAKEIYEIMNEAGYETGLLKK